MIDTKKLREEIALMNQTKDLTASMNAEFRLARQVPELLDEREKLIDLLKEARHYWKTNRVFHHELWDRVEDCEDISTEGLG